MISVQRNAADSQRQLFVNKQSIPFNFRSNRRGGVKKTPCRIKRKNHSVINGHPLEYCSSNVIIYIERLEYIFCFLPSSKIPETY